MSDMPPPGTPPGQPPPFEINYQTPPATGNAALLVRLSAIFNFVSAGLDLMYLAYAVFFCLRLYYTMGVAMHRPGAAGAAPPPPGFMTWMIVVRALPGLLSLLSIPLKAIAALQLLRSGRLAWGLAAGIEGCLEVWTCFCFPLTLAAGVYTIIILCLQPVRIYLGHAAAGQTGRFPLDG